MKVEGTRVGAAAATVTIYLPPPLITAAPTRYQSLVCMQDQPAPSHLDTLRAALIHRTQSVYYSQGGAYYKEIFAETRASTSFSILSLTPLFGCTRLVIGW